MKTRLYINLKNREKIDQGIRNYIEFKTKKREKKRMNKVEYMRKRKGLKKENAKKYFKNENKKMEEKRMNKKEFVRMYKEFKGEKECKKTVYYVRLPKDFIEGEIMAILEKINKVAYWLFFEMVFETNRTEGFIKNNSDLMKTIVTNTQRDVGRQLTIDEIVKAINTLMGYGLIKKTINGLKILNYSKFYYSA